MEIGCGAILLGDSGAKSTRAGVVRVAADGNDRCVDVVLGHYLSTLGGRIVRESNDLGVQFFELCRAFIQRNELLHAVTAQRP